MICPFVLLRFIFIKKNEQAIVGIFYFVPKIITRFQATGDIDCVYFCKIMINCNNIRTYFGKIIALYICLSKNRKKGVIFAKKSLCFDVVYRVVYSYLRNRQLFPKYL